MIATIYAGLAGTDQGDGISQAREFAYLTNWQISRARTLQPKTRTTLSKTSLAFQFCGHNLVHTIKCIYAAEV
jgi:hypothetical protein